MDPKVIAVQIALGIILFFIINWLGKQSYSIGYISISMFTRAEEAPAFNFILRVLTPIVYIIIAATILYTLKLDAYIKNLYLVNVYYILFRLLFNIATGRILLLNWSRQFLYWSSIIIISYFAYVKLISEKKNILPDFTTLANELWIIIIVFVYHIANKIELSQEATIKRNENYLKVSFIKFKNMYGDVVTQNILQPQIQALAYSIMIHENFNRPKLARLIENLRFLVTYKPHTLGLMQVYTKDFINDYESVIKGSEIIQQSYEKNKNRFDNGETSEYYDDGSLISNIISDYNTGYQYQSDVKELYDLIKETFYKNVPVIIAEPVE